jgi:hypothetical protein
LSRYLKPDLLVIDDMGMKPLPLRSGEVLFEIIIRRYETRSTMMTSNRPLEDWGKFVSHGFRRLPARLDDRRTGQWKDHGPRRSEPRAGTRKESPSERGRPSERASEVAAFCRTKRRSR